MNHTTTEVPGPVLQFLERVADGSISPQAAGESIIYVLLNYFALAFILGLLTGIILVGLVSALRVLAHAYQNYQKRHTN